MSLAKSRPKLTLTAGLNTSDSAVKMIMYQALLLFIDDIRQLIRKNVETGTKDVVDDPDQTLRSHALERREALKKWIKVESPLAWRNDTHVSGNYADLSLILCEDPNTEHPALTLNKGSVTYDRLADNISDFITNPDGRRPAPLTKDGGFQYVLPIAYDMIGKLAPPDITKSAFWSRHLIDMMKKMDIVLIPWHKETRNAYATDLGIWTALRPTKGLPSYKMTTFRDRIQEDAEQTARQDPSAPWDLPDQLCEVKELWKKVVLPSCWDIQHATLCSTNVDSKYVTETYQYVKDHYDGKKWPHHLALIVAICFSRVVPYICLDNTANIMSTDSASVTEWIRGLEWVRTQSASHKGTVAPLPFIVMMSTALIGFWDSHSPLAKQLRAKNGVLGKPWSEKHGAWIQYSFDGLHFNTSIFVAGPKQIHALNFIRMGLAIATTAGVRKNAKFKSNWVFKSDQDLKLLYSKLMNWLTTNTFGEYLAIHCLFGENIARKLSEQDQFTAPVI